MPKKQNEEIETKEREPKSAKSKYVLRLYVAGTSRKSLQAMQNLKKILSELEEEYELEIIDVYQQPIFAKSGQIVALPTLVKELPPPLRKLVGDLSSTDNILAGLDISREE